MGSIIFIRWDILHTYHELWCKYVWHHWKGFFFLFQASLNGLMSFSKFFFYFFYIFIYFWSDLTVLPQLVWSSLYVHLVMSRPKWSSCLCVYHYLSTLWFCGVFLGLLKFMLNKIFTKIAQQILTWILTKFFYIYFNSQHFSYHAQEFFLTHLNRIVFVLSYKYSTVIILLISIIYILLIIIPVLCFYWALHFFLINFLPPLSFSTLLMAPTFPIYSEYLVFLSFLCGPMYVSLRVLLVV